MIKILARTNTESGRIDSFVNFVVERERIRVKKEKGLPQPWTEDRILQTYHFCNVRRADDRVTKWIGEWVGKQCEDEKAWFWFAVARWFNAPETLHQFTPILQGGWDVKKMIRVCAQIKSGGASVMRGSYIINSAYSPGALKYEAVIRYPLTTLWNSPPAIFVDSISLSHAALMEYVGHGSFMAGQIVADWQTFGIIDGRDVKTWAPLGPGSNKGLKYIFADRYAKRGYLDFMTEMAAAITRRDHRLGRSLSLHDVQNCLCEFSKYVRGNSKTKYSPYQEGLL